MPPRRDKTSVDSNDNSCASSSSCIITSSPTSTTSITTSQPIPTETTMTTVLSHSSSLLPYNNMSTTATTTAATISASELVSEQRNQLYVANAKLCRLVQKFPWMYDRSHPNYAKKQILDRSWMKIAKNCNDSVSSCKERWRNIRAAFARSINVYKTHGGPNRVKPYYLHSELSFLIKPMMNSRSRSKADVDHLIKTDDSEDERDDEIDEANQEKMKNENEKIIGNEELTMNIDETDEEFAAILEPEAEIDINLENIDENFFKELTRRYVKDNSTRRDQQEMVGEVLESRERENIISEPKHINCGNIYDDSDAKFFEALLPDVKNMNAYQKIVFKRKIYQALQEVYENKEDHQARCCSTTNSQSFMSKIDKMNRNDLLTLSKYVEEILLRRHITQHEHQQHEMRVSQSGGPLKNYTTNTNQNKSKMVRIPTRPSSRDDWNIIDNVNASSVKEEIDLDI